jgi:hypothetical protein
MNSHINLPKGFLEWLSFIGYLIMAYLIFSLFLYAAGAILMGLEHGLGE